VDKIKKDCKECEGTGTIRFFFDCDSTRDTPCPKCFPEKKHIYENVLKDFRESSRNERIFG
jgi:hypothetical protein